MCPRCWVCWRKSSQSDDSFQGPLRALFFLHYYLHVFFLFMCVFSLYIYSATLDFVFQLSLLVFSNRYHSFTHICQLLCRSFRLRLYRMYHVYLNDLCTTRYKNFAMYCYIWFSVPQKSWPIGLFMPKKAVEPPIRATGGVTALLHYLTIIKLSFFFSLS